MFFDQFLSLKFEFSLCVEHTRHQYSTEQQDYPTFFKCYPTMVDGRPTASLDLSLFQQ